MRHAATSLQSGSILSVWHRRCLPFSRVSSIPSVMFFSFPSSFFNVRVCVCVEVRATAPFISTVSAAGKRKREILFSVFPHSTHAPAIFFFLALSTFSYFKICSLSLLLRSFFFFEKKKSKQHWPWLYKKEREREFVDASSARPLPSSVGNLLLRLDFQNWIVNFDIFQRKTPNVFCHTWWS